MHILYNIFQPEKISAATQQGWLAELPDVKQEKISRLHYRNDQLRSLIGLQLLKQAMQAAGFNNFSLKSVQFPEQRKPLTLQDNVDFSISHSHDLVVCVLSNNCRVGIDTEKHKDIDAHNFSGYMSEQELANIRVNPVVFFDYWSIKEAVMKAASQASLSNIKRIHINENTAILHDAVWHLFRLDILPDYSSYVATDCVHPDIITTQIILD